MQFELMLESVLLTRDKCLKDVSMPNYIIFKLKVLQSYNKSRTLWSVS